nr:immunoglobulin heavy chain junction region [Macaca mulatta]MOV56837.1 immunoglobulin heavy chain junction region [Macaca mulatta]MOV57183.1 immunoglobulin heavy chain junction region [Macaca mulatta]MOV58688.1 immunoglobulin heavy chain junction region [Macaca mulatta]
CTSLGWNKARFDVW